MTTPVIGIDVGGTKMLGVVLGEDGRVLAEDRRSTMHQGESLLDDLTELCRDLLAGEDAHPASGGGEAAVRIGVGVPGLVDLDGVLRFAPNLLSANGMALRSDLERRLEGQAEVHVNNDANCAAVGEWSYGAAVGRSDVLFVTLGTGIGGGILSSGRLLRGAGNFGAEIGHMVVNPHGPPCGCGRRGCWERYASGSGLGRIARDGTLAGKAPRVRELAGGDPDDVRGEHVIEAAGDGDADAAAMLDEFAEWIALGLGNLADILDPEIIVIGGGLVAAGEAIFGRVRAAFPRHLLASDSRPEIEIVPAVLGEHSGAIGAAALAAQLTDEARTFHAEPVPRAGEPPLGSRES